MVGRSGICAPANELGRRGARRAGRGDLKCERLVLLGGAGGDDVHPEGGAAHNLIDHHTQAKNVRLPAQINLVGLTTARHNSVVPTAPGSLSVALRKASWDPKLRNPLQVLQMFCMRF